jgi:phosphoribosylformylglycinamidine cyclo-ligase
MYQVFNMGHRFEIYTDPETAGRIITLAADFNLDAKIVGRCEASESKKLTISSEFGTFEY